MKYYLIVFLLASSVLLTSCSSTKHISDSNNTIAAPLASINKTALYKASIEVFGNFFSGLVLFKYNADKQDYNIVLLSEVGLTLCEFYAANNTVEVRSASSLFQSEMAQNTLAEDFGFLLNNPGVVNQLSELEYKNKDKIKYTVGAEMTPQQIRKRRLINGVVVDLSSYDEGLPSSINFKHRGIKFKMQLTLLKQK